MPPPDHPPPAVRSVAELCRLASPLRDPVLASLVPPALADHCCLPPPGEWGDAPSSPYRWHPFPADQALRLEVWPDPAGRDPALALELRDTSDGNLEAGWIVLNDLSGPRFHLDRAPDGASLAVGGPLRNQAEEQRALAAGLAPNQVRPGLRLFRPLIEGIEALARRLGKDHLFVVPLAYHNAIKYEHYGFGYTEAPRELRWIDRQFRPGGCLRRRMNGNRPFRQPWMADTIRGRSWAIRDGVLGRHWAAPRMVKTLDRPEFPDTFPGGRW